MPGFVVLNICWYLCCQAAAIYFPFPFSELGICPAVHIQNGHSFERDNLNINNKKVGFMPTGCAINRQLSA